MNYKSFDNSYIYFNNYNENKDNKILFLSEHSGSAFPGEIQVSSDDNLLEIFKKKLHYDWNSLEISQYLNKKFNSILVTNKFSHLLCDPCLNVSDSNLIPLKFENFDLKFNKLNFQEQEIRISKYYIGFHISLRYLQDNHKIDFVVSIHSHNEENFDFIIDYYLEDEFSKSIYNFLKEKKFKVSLNPNNKKHFYLANDEIIVGLTSRKRQGFLISFQRYLKDAHIIISDAISSYLNN